MILSIYKYHVIRGTILIILIFVKHFLEVFMSKQNRLKILPDKIFQELWNRAESKKDSSADEYVSYFLSAKSEGRIDFYRKYSIDEITAGELLTNIYEANRLSFRSILNEAKVKKAEISRIFCIPIRTIEDWYSDKNKCPSYIRLMLLRHYYLIYLGKYITLESEQRRKELKPSTYNKVEKSTQKDKTEKNESTLLDDIDKLLEEIETDEPLISYEDYRRSRNDLEKPYSSPISEILQRTDYLRERMERRRKQ